MRKIHILYLIALLLALTSWQHFVVLSTTIDIDLLDFAVISLALAGIVDK